MRLDISCPSGEEIVLRASLGAGASCGGRQVRPPFDAPRLLARLCGGSAVERIGELPGQPPSRAGLGNSFPGILVRGFPVCMESPVEDEHHRRERDRHDGGDDSDHRRVSADEDATDAG